MITTAKNWQIIDEEVSVDKFINCDENLQTSIQLSSNSDEIIDQIINEKDIETIIFEEKDMEMEVQEESDKIICPTYCEVNEMLKKLRVCANKRKWFAFWYFTDWK